MTTAAGSIAARLAALAWLCLSTPAWSLAPGAAAEIVNVQGAGEQRPAGATAWQPARVQQELAAGDFVRTLEFARMALLFADQTQLRLHHKTVLQVKAIAGPAQQPTSVLLQVGRAWMQTRRAFAGAPLRMETPTATLGIRGTDWHVEVSPEGHTLLTVLSGRVTVGHELGDLEVGPNESALVERGKAPVKIQLSQPRDRIQWVNALVAEPQRWIAGGTTPELAQIAAQVGRGELAAAHARLAQIVGGGAAPQAAYLLLADLQMVLGENDAAIATLHGGLRAHPGAPQLRAQLALAQLLAGRMDDGRATLGPVRADDPASMWIARGALARREGAARATLEAYGRATQLAPDDARGWFGLGSAHTEREDSVPARASLLRALQLDPRGPGYRGELGTLETFRNDLPAAEAAFAQALADNPADYVARTGQGLLRLKQGRTAAALEDFLRAGVMEPRFARARTYTGVAYWQLGRRGDAIETLRQAAALDDKDPLPHLFLAQIHTDLYRAGEAVQASREALARMPFVKSLNQIANDQQGRANLGAALAFFGLDDWAQELAHEAYYPYWGASHLFLADRYLGEFVKNSELFQGFLADPLAFGAAPGFSPLLQQPGHYGTAGLTLERRFHQAAAPSLTLNGLRNEDLPAAYFLKVQTAHGSGYPIGFSADDRPMVFDSTGTSRPRLRVGTLGLGALPTERLALFAYYNDVVLNERGDNRVPDARGNIASSTGDSAERKLAVGASWRWSPTAQTWLKVGYATTALEAQATPYGLAQGGIVGTASVAVDADKRLADLQWRHTVDLAGGTRLFAAFEQIRERQASASQSSASVRVFRLLQDALTVATLQGIERNMRVLTAGVQHPVGSVLRLEGAAAATWLRQSLHFDRTVAFSRLSAFNDRTRQIDDHHGRVAAGRFGLVWHPAPGWIVRAAHQDWLRPISKETLSPVDVAGLPFEDRLQAGGRIKRRLLQVGWNPDERTYVQARLARLVGVNPDNTGLDLRTPAERFLEELRNSQMGSYRYVGGTPDVERARLRSAQFRVNRVLSSRSSVSGAYEYLDTDSWPAQPARDPTDWRIPMTARHTFKVSATWVSEQRLWLTASAVYQSEQFTDKKNLSRLPARWKFDATGHWESADKRWLVRINAAEVLSRRSEREKPFYILHAVHRF